jgi:hypothetical protein
MQLNKPLLLFTILAIALSLLGCSQVETRSSPGIGDLHVLVLSPENNPVSGAKVVSNTQPDGQLKVTGLTGGDGTVTYNDIKAGNYEFYISSQYQQKEFAVNVVSGQITNITITLEEK